MNTEITTFDYYWAASDPEYEPCWLILTISYVNDLYQTTKALFFERAKSYFTVTYISQLQWILSIQ